MNPEDFESQLRQQSLRSLPSEWRREILATAAKNVRSTAAAPVPQRSGLGGLAALFWPHPGAWAGLAATWVAIAALNHAGAGPEPVTVAKSSPPTSPAMILVWREQQQELLRLVMPQESEAVEPTTGFIPRPRGSRAGYTAWV